MAGDRLLVSVSGCDQWVRAAHHDTAVGTGGVGLHWDLPPIEPPDPTTEAAAARGLAFDRFCRAYAVREHNIDRIRLGNTASGVDYATVAPPVELFTDDTTPYLPGSFVASSPRRALADPSGVGVDADDRLVVAERGARRIVFVDLWQRRTLRTVTTSASDAAIRAPVGLAVDGTTVWVVTREPAALLRLTANTDTDVVDLPPLPPGAEPLRVTVLAGRPVLLARTPDGRAWLVAEGMAPRDVGPASDLTASADLVVVAPARGVKHLIRYAAVAGTWQPVDALDASGYDGGGIAETPAGRIAYTTATGVRLAVGVRVRYAPQGRVVTFRLDAGVPGARWGRIFVDACLPPNTDVRYAIRTSDDVALSGIDHTAADPALCVPYRPELTPPLPALRDDVDVAEVTGRLYPRADHPTPWWRHRADENVVTLEGYADAPPGRYGWVTLRLTGTTSVTPVVRALRLEAVSHDLDRRLPAVFTEFDEASFLHRYLALFDGMLHDLDRRAAHRELLVDPASAPEEALDWLASFIGLLLDERWPVEDRRLLIAEAAWLYRYRGTEAALRRYLTIYLHSEPVILEHFRLRGVGGPLLRDDGQPSPGTGFGRSVLGYGMRVGGQTDAGVSDRAAEAFATHAHRFSVLIARSLNSEQLAVVRHVLDRERPAHTAYEICTVAAGLRVGIGAHLQLSTVIGRTGGFAPIILDRGRLGVDKALGRARPGPVVEASRLGRTRIG